MSRKTTRVPPEPPQRAVLLVPRETARAQLNERIEMGKRLASEADYKLWTDYNLDMLKRIFSTEEYAKEYNTASAPRVLYVSPSFRGRASVIDWRQKIPPRLTCLESIVGRLDLIEAPETPTGADRVLQAYEGLDLHPDIADAASQLYRDGHFANAIEDAVKALNARVRLRSGVELDGAELMQRVFAPKSPVLRFNDLADDSDRNEQMGFMMMFSGAVAGLRNPRAHKLIKDDAERALEFIAFVSLLAKLLDGAKKGPPPKA